MEKLAKLAMLSVRDVERFGDDIDEIMQLARVLDNMETNILTTEGECELREDKINPSFSREKILANAPVTEDGFIIVPKVVG